MAVSDTIDAPPMPAKPKPFKWSFSKLKNFRTCPKRHYHCDIKREFKEDSTHLDWGKTVHKALEHRIERGTQLPPVMDPYEIWAKGILKYAGQGARIRVEQKLAFDKDFMPTEADWKNPNAWFVCTVDVLVLGNPDHVLAVDWKTGKVDADSQQLMLTSQAVFSHYPNVKRVTTTYVWLKHDTETTETYTQNDLLSMWNGLLPELKMIEQAERTEHYPPTPNGLCRAHCPVTSCPYHGKGSY